MHKHSLIQTEVRNKGFAPPLVILVVLIAIVGGAYYLWKTNKFLIAPPGCHYDKVQCVMAPCDPVLVCSSNSSTTQTTLASPSATPIVDETANWKTYSCDSFSIKYPTKWNIVDGCKSIIKPKSSDSVEYVGQSVFQTYPYKDPGQRSYYEVNPSAPNGMIVYIRVYSNPQKLDVGKFVLSAEGLNHGGTPGWQWSQEKLGNYTFLKETVVGNEPFYYLVDGGRKAYWLSPFIFEAEQGSQMSNDQKESYRRIFNQMLSTFKFTQ